jgi:hypothetical protein
MKRVFENIKNILIVAACLVGILYVLAVPVGCLIYAFIHGGFFK